MNADLQRALQRSRTLAASRAAAFEQVAANARAGECETCDKCMSAWRQTIDRLSSAAEAFEAALRSDTPPNVDEFEEAAQEALIAESTYIRHLQQHLAVAP